MRAANREYADPPRLVQGASATERQREGRRVRDDIAFAEALAGADTGSDVWLVDRRGIDSIGPVEPDAGGMSEVSAKNSAVSVIDIVDVDDALPGPWQYDVVSLAQVVAERFGERFVADAAAGYQRGISALAHGPLHAANASATGLAAKEARGMVGAGWRTAERRLVTRGETPLLRRDRVAARWGETGLVDIDASREVAHFRETLAEPTASLLSQYAVADAVADESGRLLVLLARAADDVVCLEATPVHATPLEARVGAWREGSDLQRVLLARELIPLAPAGMLGWTTSADGLTPRAWSRARDRGKAHPRWWSGKRSGARALGTTLGLAHGRSGDAARLAGYLGFSEKFGRALHRRLARG